MKTRVLILYVKAGQGHYGIANAVSDALAAYFPNDFECFVEDAFREDDDFFHRLFEDFYKFMATFMAPAWSFGYYCFNFPPLHNCLLRVIKWRTKKRLQGIVNQVRPDIIFLTHPLLQRVAAELKVRNAPPPELFHFVVDVEPQSWYMKYRQYNILVSTPHLKEYACRHFGYPERRVCVSPPPLRAEFYRWYGEQEIKVFKKKYGFEDHRPIILIFGGGNGLPQGEKVVFYVLQHKLDADIAIVCGRNDFQRRVVELMVTHFGDERQKVHIFGFIQEIYELMAISDVVISKAGFTAIFEILTAKKSLIFSEFIWGQEKGNAMYLIRHKIGFYIKRPSKIARKVEALLHDRSLREELQANLSRLKLKNGARETAYFIKRIMDERRGTEEHFDNI